MKDGTKEILVYNYVGEEGSPEADTEIGRVFVSDPDDWDLRDKKFFWENHNSHAQFLMDPDSGMIRMKRNTLPGTYELEFGVYDRKHVEAVSAHVSVVVRGISHEAIQNAGSIRIAGMSDEDFIRTWDYKVNI